MFTPFSKDNPAFIGDLQDELNRLLNRWWHSGITTPPFDGQEWAPPWDVLEKPDEYVARLEMAGFDAADVEVTYVGQTLTIKGCKESDAPESGQGTYLRRERRSGSFARSVQLTEPVDPERLRATCSNGLLTVVLPKKADPAKRTVKVEVKPG